MFAFPSIQLVQQTNYILGVREHIKGNSELKQKLKLCTVLDNLL